MAGEVIEKSFTSKVGGVTADFKLMRKARKDCSALREGAQPGQTRHPASQSQRVRLGYLGKDVEPELLHHYNTISVFVRTPAFAAPTPLITRSKWPA